MKVRKRLKKTRGDTIVEVLIAIAVVSAVLGAAFVASNDSLSGTRQSQERGEALKLLEGQIERLKEAARTSEAIFTTTTSPFCLDNSLMPRSNTASVCSQGTDGRYKMEIIRTRSDSTYTFNAKATWDRLGGGQDMIEIQYRTHR